MNASCSDCGAVGSFDGPSLPPFSDILILPTLHQRPPLHSPPGSPPRNCVSLVNFVLLPFSPLSTAQPTLKLDYIMVEEQCRTAHLGYTVLGSAVPNGQLPTLNLRDMVLSATSSNKKQKCHRSMAF
eukprot:scaffold23530_cov167-Skeletonema_marinoi.AAC.1